MPHLSMARGKRARNFQFLLTAGNVEEGGGGKQMLAYICEIVRISRGEGEGVRQAGSIGTTPCI